MIWFAVAFLLVPAAESGMWCPCSLPPGRSRIRWSRRRSRRSTGGSGRGFLDRARSAQDERVVIVSLTERGRALKNDLAHVPSCMAESFGVSLEQARELTDTLRRLTARMHATADGSSPAETTSGQPPAAADHER
jgi:hypothetical protein